MTVVGIYFLLIQTQLNCIHCFSHCCKKWGIPLFSSERKFKFVFFNVGFTGFSSRPSVLVPSVLHAQSGTAVSHLLLLVLVTAVKLVIVYCTLFCRSKMNMLIFLSSDEKCSLINNHQFVWRFKYFWVSGHIYIFAIWLQCHISVHHTYWLVLGCKSMTVILVCNS
jgi:hypothetical protein